MLKVTDISFEFEPDAWSSSDKMSYDVDVHLTGVADDAGLQELKAHRAIVKDITRNKLKFCDESMHNLLTFWSKGGELPPTAKFSGGMYLNDKFVFITKVIYNKPATIVFWSDNTKTVSKCAEADEYNKEAGLLMCFMKKMLSNDYVHDLLEEWAQPDKNVVTLKDLRKDARAKKLIKAKK